MEQQAIRKQQEVEEHVIQRFVYRVKMKNDEMDFLANTEEEEEEEGVVIIELNVR